MDSIICSSDNRSLDSSLHHCKTAVETALVPVEERRPSVSVTSLGTVSSASTRVKVPVKPERYALCEGTRRQIVQGTDNARLRCLSVRDGGSAHLVEGCVRQVGPRCLYSWLHSGVTSKGQFLGWRPLWPAARETPDVWVPQ